MGLYHGGRMIGCDPNEPVDDWDVHEDGTLIEDFPERDDYDEMDL